MKDTDLAWLAGMWEGEGNIMLYSRPVNEKRIQITPSLEITNCDIHLINSCRRILEELGCNFSFIERKPRKQNHRLAFTLRTQNCYYIKIVLENMMPFMVGEKRAYGETLLSFVSKRIEKAKDQTNGNLKRLRYDEDDYEFVRSSTTTRETS